MFFLWRIDDAIFNDEEVNSSQYTDFKIIKWSFFLQSFELVYYDVVPLYHCK